FLAEAQLDRVGCFKYSDVDGATANELPDHIDESVKKERLQRFMAVQAKISAAKLQARIGQEYLILVDEVNDLGIVGRSYMDAPEVDGKVYLSDDFDAKPGDQLWVQIIHADEHDVWGVRVED
ncbi:MAG: 30S ribosomal protein S12 methylthiotransferase RimO, partial [Litorilituus sp.]|nr:30S ribosomal protein S12 methylthiotransferase RimO [Litorilituus sp.]